MRRTTGRPLFATMVTLIITRMTVRRMATGGRTTSQTACSLASGHGITATTGASMEEATTAEATTGVVITDVADTVIEEVAALQVAAIVVDLVEADFEAIEAVDSTMVVAADSVAEGSAAVVGTMAAVAVAFTAGEDLTVVAIGNLG
jgi:hypothetical protein